MIDSPRDLLMSLGIEVRGDVRSVPVGGGCISQAVKVSWSDSRDITHSIFMKRNSLAFVDNFECEFKGLELLHRAGAIRVPKPVAVKSTGASAWLVTQWIQEGSRPKDFFETFGVQLAKLHRVTLGSRIGLDHDNYLGATKQINAPDSGESRDWVSFVVEHRLGYQLRLAERQGLVNSSLRRDVEKTIERLPDLLAGRAEETSLLHGDLWSGNYLCDPQGQPVVIDPAVHYGCREAEWGMILLFGGCGEAFKEAYQSEFPMPDGWTRRAQVYVLYHLLNHLNLFGASYGSQCQSVARDLLRAS